MRKYAVIAACFALVGAFSMGTSNAAAVPGPQVVVAQPGAFTVGFATTDIHAVKSAPLVFANADVQNHNLWICVDSACLTTIKSPTGGAGTYAQIDLGSLAVGKTYKFFCSIHSSTMVGHITIEG